MTIRSGSEEDKNTQDGLLMITARLVGMYTETQEAEGVSLMDGAITLALDLS